MTKSNMNYIQFQNQGYGILSFFQLLEDKVMEAGQREAVRIQISMNLFLSQVVGQKHPLLCYLAWFLIPDFLIKKESQDPMG